MTNLYEISYMYCRIEQYITNLARLALFVCRAYSWYYTNVFNTFTRHSGHWSRGTILASHAESP